MHKPRAPRIEAEIPIFFYGGRVEGEGLIRDISATGAQIRQATAPVVIGHKLTLEIGLGSDLPSCRVAAEVVGPVDDGFAVSFFFDTPAERTVIVGLLDVLVSQPEVAGAEQALRKTRTLDPAPSDRQAGSQAASGAAPAASTRAGSESSEPTISDFQRAILDTHGCRSDLRERTSVRLGLEGESVWEGRVLVFDLIGHPKALTCYAWAVDQELRTMLHEGPVKSPETAVRASMADGTGG